MHGRGHAVAGALAGVGVAALTGLPTGLGLVTIAVAAATAHGRLSPDIDLWLHGSGIFAHRRLTHWPGAVLAVTLAGFVVVAVAQPALWWVWAAVCTGWWAHLAGDMVFGQANVRAGRGRGIPFRGPTRGWVGVGLKSGGPAERALTWTVGVPALVWALHAWSGVPWVGVAVGVVVAGALSGRTTRHGK